MASEDRKAPCDLSHPILREPKDADFFYLVRVLQCVFRDQPRVGEALTPNREQILFGQPPYLEFPPSAVEDVRLRGGRGKDPVGGGQGAAGEPGPEEEMVRVKILQRFFGLFGPNGPLPLHLTEYAMGRARWDKDPVFGEFADIFHHRLASFFFRAWAMPRMEVDLDRGIEQSRFARYIGSLGGIGSREVQSGDSIPGAAKLHYVGHLARQVRNLEGLASILGDFFQVPVEVLDFQGKWLELPPESKCRLGQSRSSSELGMTTILGSMTWNSQLSIRVRMGPLGLEELERFLPGSKSFKRLGDWIRLYCDQPFFWDLQMILKRDQVPELRLGQAGRLGWTTWLMGGKATSSTASGASKSVGLGTRIGGPRMERGGQEPATRPGDFEYQMVKPKHDLEDLVITPVD